MPRLKSILTAAGFALAAVFSFAQGVPRATADILYVTHAHDLPATGRCFAATIANPDPLCQVVFVENEGRFYLWNSTLAQWDVMDTTPPVAWGDITGTLANQTDLQAAIDAAASAPAWGDITGTLANQTDLSNALAAKVPFSGGQMTGNLTFDPASGNPRWNNVPGNKWLTLTASPTDNRTVIIQDGDGTLAFLTDLDAYMLLTGGTVNGSISSQGFFPIVTDVYNLGDKGFSWSQVWGNSFMLEGAEDDFEMTITGAFTADRTATMQDGTGTVAWLSDVAQGIVDAVAAAVDDSISDGITTVAPSQNAVFDALALKANLVSPTFTGTVTIPTPFTLGATSVTATGTEMNLLVGHAAALVDIDDAVNTAITGVGTLTGLSLSGDMVFTNTGRAVWFESGANDWKLYELSNVLYIDRVGADGFFQINTNGVARFYISASNANFQVPIVPGGNGTLDIGATTLYFDDSFIEKIACKEYLDIADANGTATTCDSSTRGRIVVEEGAGGVTDNLYMCMKAAADTYSWVSIKTGG